MDEKDNIKRHYELTDNTIEVDGHVLHQIICTETFNFTNKGDLGGFIEDYENLQGNGWGCNNAKVYGGAIVRGNGIVGGNATISGICDIEGTENIGGEVVINSYKVLHINNGFIFGDAVINSCYDYITFKNWWSSGRSFTWTRSNDMWSVGCFYGTGKELIAKAYKDSEVSGREYEIVVKYVESIKKADKPTIFQRLKKKTFLHNI